MRYSEEFYARHAAGSLQAAQAIVPIIVECFAPTSVVDVGCGLGAWLKVFRDNGVHKIHGYDGTWVKRKRLLIDGSAFSVVDLAGSSKLDGRFDVAVSLEVAEHIPDHSADKFVANLVGLSDCIVFSAAIPGQGGDGHVNEQWPSYWAHKFAGYGYEVFDIVRPRIWTLPEVVWWYKQNVLVYVKHAEKTKCRFLRRECEAPLDVVHPECFFQRAICPPFRNVLRSFPSSLWRAVKARLPAK